MTDPKVPLWTRDFILLSIANLALFTSFFLLVPTVPKFAASVFGASKIQIGYLVGIISVSSVMVRPFAGYLLDSLDRRMVYLVSLAGCTLCILFYNLTTTFILFFIIRFVHGIFSGTATTCGPTVIGDIISPFKRGEGIGYFGLSTTLAMAIGPLFGVILMGDNSFHLVFFGSAILGGVALLLIGLVRLPKVDTIKRPLTRQSFFEGKVLPLSLIMLFNSIGWGGVISFITLYIEEIGMKDGSGIFFLVYAISLSIIRPKTGKIFDKQGPKYILTVGFVALIVGFVLLSQWKSAAGILTAAMLIGFGNGLCQPTLAAMIFEMVPLNRCGVANSTLFSAVDLGVGGGSILLGWLAEYTSLSTIFLVCGLIIIFPLIYFNMNVYNKYLIITKG